MESAPRSGKMVQNMRENGWVDNKATGKGKFWYTNGDVYEGDWHEDQAIGQGVLIHANGQKYEGGWKNN